MLHFVLRGLADGASAGQVLFRVREARKMHLASVNSI